MKPKRAWALALALGTLSIPIQASGQQPWCTYTWYISVCADETWNASGWHESMSIYVPENTTGKGIVITTSGAGTVDISVVADTNAGDLAIVGVLDVSKFLAQNPDRASDLLGLAAA